MGFWEKKNEKDYDAEIALLNKRQNELSVKTDENKSEVISLGIDFGEYKEFIGNQFNEVWDFMKSLNSDLSDFKKWKEEQKQEIDSTKKAKTELPDTLTYKEVCQSLNGFTYLDVTSFKYYLYENGILDLKINPIRNTYKISNDFDTSTSELKQYIHITDGVITFDKAVLDYLVKNSVELQNSINKYNRKQNQFNKSKQHLAEIQVTDYQAEINRICGIKDSFDGKKWGMIYKRYELDHKNWKKNYEAWKEKYLEEHPYYKYATQITYLVQEVGDGDVLLKIACELFVDQVGDILPNYVKIPREIIYNKDIGDKRVIIFSYLCSRRALDDTVAFSISELCHWSHLKPNYHDGKINQKYLEVLELLSHQGYFAYCPDFQKLAKEKKNSTDYYNIKLNIEKFDIPDSFGIIYFNELERILNFKEELEDIDIDLSRMSSAYILLFLSYLRVNMNRNSEKPLGCYRLYQKISEDIGLSERYISRIVEILDVMNIIKYQEGKRKRYKKSNGEYGFITSPKVFADYRRYIKDKNGNVVIDTEYDCKSEITKQIEILNMN